MIRSARKLWKDANSGKSGCPALYEVADGGVPGYAVQGKHPAMRLDGAGWLVYGRALTPAELAVLDNVADDEAAVWAPAFAFAAATSHDSEAVRDLAPGEGVVWVPANVLDRLPVA